MRRFLLIGWLLIAVLFLATESFAQVSLSTVLFLRIAAGARAAGMGESFVAIADDATATHWNPAGLGLYPLASTWLDYKGKTEHEFKSLALLGNDNPENNYNRYDLWAISGTKLYTWTGQDWQSFLSYPVSSGENAESIVRKYTQEKDENRLKKMLAQLGWQNCGISVDSMESLKGTVLSFIPQDSPRRADSEKGWDELITALGNSLLDRQALKEFLNIVGNAVKDSSITTQEEELILSSSRKSILKSLPATIEIPYSVLFLDSLNFIHSDDKTLWVGANSGLYKYDGKVWTRFSSADGLPADRVYSLAFSPTGTIWIGTDSGVVKFDGKGFTRTYLAPEVKDYRITHIAARNDKEVWAASSKELMKFDGTLFITYYMLSVKSLDELNQEMRKFLDREDEGKLDMVYKRIEEMNYIIKEQISSASQPLKIDYSLALEGKVTCLTFDRKGSLLVGTETGFLKFEDGKWKRYGYKKYEVKNEKTVEEVAEKFLPYKDKERIENLAGKIVLYNHLSTNELKPGQKLYVYANSLGSPILSISMAGEDNLFVGTEFGTLRFDGENWGKYYHADLERATVHTIIYKDKDIFFGTDDKAVIYAHAKRELTFMHANLLPELATDVYYEYLSYVQNTENWGTLGGNITFISYGSIPRTESSPEVVGELNPYEAAITLSYGTRMGKRLSLGLGAKFIYSHLSDQGAGKERGSGTGSSFAIDAGLIYKTPLKKLTLGAAVTNLGPDVSYIDVDQADPLPRNLALGFAYKLFDTPYNKLTLVGELNKELVDVGGDIGKMMKQAVKNGGMEYWYANYIALRAGYIYDKIGDIKTATFGFGLRISLLRIDFAYVPANQNVALANTTRVSGTIRF
jgi:ligand-binding sensor domain-containing protein